MRRDETGRLWPETAEEHLLFWPLAIAGLTAVYFVAHWAVDQIDPAIWAATKWITSWL